jgi:hypothetical protein
MHSRYHCSTGVLEEAINFFSKPINQSKLIEKIRVVLVR